MPLLTPQTDAMGRFEPRDVSPALDGGPSVGLEDMAINIRSDLWKRPVPGRPRSIGGRDALPAFDAGASGELADAVAERRSDLWNRPVPGKKPPKRVGA